MGVLILGLIVVAAMVLFTAVVHPVRFVLNTLQTIFAVAGIIMIYFSFTMGVSLGPAWASLFFIVTIILLFGANRIGMLKMRLMHPSR